VKPLRFILLSWLRTNENKWGSVLNMQRLLQTASITAGIMGSGGSSIPSASNWRSLILYFLVVVQ
jgi:hypothetical protein